jgi:hypothetical protein
MKVCQHCQKEIPSDFPIGRQAQCPGCAGDLHCCINCVFYERGAYNDCRENQAERVVDKNRSNFCDFFRFRETRRKSEVLSPDPREKLEALFKNE